MMSSIGAAQKQVEHQQMAWYGYNNTIRFDTTWSLISEVNERRFINPDAQYQFLIRTQLRRRLGAGWAMAAGMSIFYQSPNDPESGNDLVVPELRPHLEFDFHHKFHSFRLEHRYKAEARFFHNINTTKTELEEGYTYATLRLRYRLQFFIPVLKLGEVKSLSLRAGDEILLNAGKKIVNNVFDQNRWFVGLNMAFSPSFSLEAGYLNVFQAQTSAGEYYNRDIFRLTLYQIIQ